MINVSRLRRDVPVHDTPELEEAWGWVLKLLAEVGELEIPCAMSVDVRRVLFKTVRAMGARSILDIGTYTGTSALNFALAVTARGRVTTVDIADVNDPEGHWKRAGRSRTPLHLMKLADADARVEFVEQDSVEYLRNTKKSFDLICLDGWHEDFAVYDEIRLALRRLNPEGILVMDDVQRPGYVRPEGIDEIPGPWLALKRHLDEGAPLCVTDVVPGQAAVFLTRA